MSTITEGYTIARDKKTGVEVMANGNMLAVTASGKNLWFPKNTKQEKFITYKVHQKGDTFVAARDSQRTKGEVLGANCPKGQENLPLYSKGETVTRAAESIEFIGFSGESITKELSFEDKLALAAKYGVQVKL